MCTMHESSISVYVERMRVQNLLSVHLLVDVLLLLFELFKRRRCRVRCGRHCGAQQ